MSAPVFPPLFSGRAVEAGTDPFAHACALAAAGCDAGLVVHDIAADRLRAAIVFSPDVALADAVAMLPVCGIGIQNALGALAPPEVAVHLDWSGGIRVNGASCGDLRIAAPDISPQAEPAWLVVGLDLAIWPQGDDPGRTPDVTSLHAEGCGDIDGTMLLEAWVRHSLIGINRFVEDDMAKLHREWRGLAHGLGEDMQIAGKSGTFLGVDDHFGMLLKAGNTTHLVALTHLLGARP